ncbi:MAG: hypothetical protein CNLJKLNK_01010 [Holosporales bacterium]
MKILLFIFLTLLNAEESGEHKAALEKNSHPQADEKKEEEPKDTVNHSGEYFAEKPFFKLAPLVITIYKNNQPISLVNIESALETVETEWEKIRLKIPVLYNNLFTDLYQSLNTLWDQVTPLSPATIEKRFQYVCDTLLGAGNVKKVTISLILVIPKKD